MLNFIKKLFSSDEGSEKRNASPSQEAQENASSDSRGTGASAGGTTGDVVRYNIRDMTSGNEFSCREDETVFDAMNKTGKGFVTHGCGGGACGVCRVKITKGQYSAVKPMGRDHVSEEDEREGVVLACCISPRSHMELEKI